MSPGIGRLRRQVHQDHRQDVGVGGGDGELVGALPRETRGVEVAAEAEDVRQRLLPVPGRRRVSRLGGDRQCPPGLALRELEVPPLPPGVGVVAEQAREQRVRPAVHLLVGVERACGAEGLLEQQDEVGTPRR